MGKKISGSMKAQRTITDVIVHIFLVCVSIIWLIPFVWLIAHSFRGGVDRGQYAATFFPTEWTLDNYTRLFTDTSTIDFPRMFLNTLFVSICSCAISTFIVLSVSYCVSRVDWKMRKPYLNMAMVINLFPAFMSMVAIYFLLKAIGLTEGSMIPLALIIVYSAGAGTQFYVMKGYMDTIPTSLDEAALLDGCTRFQVFHKIIIPICKPMIVYQAIIGFLTPWLDFVMAKVICRTQSNYTVALGLWLMLQKEYIQNWYARFAAAAVVISIPIAILFIVMQRFYQESMSGSVKG